MTNEIDDLIAWFHGQFSPCTHPNGSPNQCEVWAERFAQTAGWISPAQAEELSNQWEAAAQLVVEKERERSANVLAGILVPNDPGLPTESTIGLIANLVTSDPCDWDHNHSCQAHGYFYIPQGEKCPQQEAKDLLEEHDWCLEGNHFRVDCDCGEKS